MSFLFRVRREVNRLDGAQLRARFVLSRFREIGSSRRGSEDGMQINLFILQRALRLVIAASLLSACSLDLSKLRSGLDVEAKSESDDSGAKNEAGNPERDATTNDTGTDAATDAKVFWWLGDAANTQNNTQPTCGYIGGACCSPGNTCDTGACLRGKCVIFGGAYQNASGCSSDYQTRNPYTAGYSCPSGFTAESDVTLAFDCGDSAEHHAPLSICTVDSQEDGDWMGVWLKTEAAGPCKSTCVVPNIHTDTCRCPSESVEIALRTSVASSCSTSQPGTIVFCLSSSIPTASFAGGYQTAASATGGCGAPNPLTGFCSCPEGATDQEIKTAGGTFHVCNR
jgi:hypothetical protein